MNFSRIFAVASTVLVLALAPLASATAAGKIGFVDLPRLLQDSPQRQDASTRVEKEFTPRKQEIQTLTTKAQALDAELKRNAESMSTTQLKKKERQLVSLQREIKREEQYFKEDLSLRNNEELVELQKVIFKTIEKVAKREGYDMVFAEGIAYYSDKVNITDLVLEQLKKDFKSGK